MESGDIYIIWGFTGSYLGVFFSTPRSEQSQWLPLIVFNNLNNTTIY